MFDFRQMRQEEAEQIATNWKYPGVYSFYNATADEEDFAEFIDPVKRGDGYFSCYVDHELVAFYSVDIVDGGKAEIGLGLKPELTGKGYGLSFVNDVVADIASRYGVTDFTLSVALFNRRAIKVYKKAGFAEAEVFVQNTNGGVYEFLRMTRCHPQAADEESFSGK